jgi:hypothetical protein
VTEWTDHGIDNSSGDILKTYFMVTQSLTFKKKFRPWNEGQGQITRLTLITQITTIIMEMIFIGNSHYE